jgi:membrane associated rhomboid family serine protease
MNKSDKKELRPLIAAFYFPLFLVMIMWIVKGAEWFFNYELAFLGVYPREIEGLSGILFSPLLHAPLKDGGISHIVNNSIAIVILGSILFYSYRPISFKIFFLVYFISGFWLWCFGRPSYHIGASGVIYGLATFIFFSGVLRKHIPLMIMSLLVAFLYGSLVWGIFPINYKISFEGHLTGAVTGLILAFYFRKEGPQKKVYEFEREDDDMDDGDEYWRVDEEGRQIN